MHNPLISIVIPVYNGSNYMREAIDSALAQTYRNIEIIVVNDGSRDDGATDAIARSYGDKIRYYTKENGGVSSALNMGIRHMQGEYFSWLSHDDSYETDKIEKQVAAIRQYSLEDNTLICCKSSLMDADSNPIFKRPTASKFVSYRVYSSKEVLSELLKKSTFNGCCLLIPRKVFSQCGLFDERLRFCQDAFMWYKIFMKDFSLLCTDDASVKSRVHAGQLTQKGQKLFKKECEEISRILVEDFAELSTEEYNFYRMYLYSDARYFSFDRVKQIISTGRKRNLLSKYDEIKALCICSYGYVRPTIRKVYYAVFRGIKTK